jgi:hypothetical protein
MSSSDWPLYRLRIAADADPGALARVLERFQNLNIVPRRVVAELATTGTLHVQVDIAGLPEETVTLIAAKLNQVPCIVNVHWHRS